MLGLLNVKFDHILNMHRTLLHSRAMIREFRKQFYKSPSCTANVVTAHRSFFCGVNVKDIHTDTHMVLMSQVNRDGASVLLHVHGFRPYFYAAKPPGEVGWGIASTPKWLVVLQHKHTHIRLPLAF